MILQYWSHKGPIKILKERDFKSCFKVIFGMQKLLMKIISRQQVKFSQANIYFNGSKMCKKSKISKILRSFILSYEC